jgi:polyisoprenyl-phosphate glycosyltransferase
VILAPKLARNPLKSGERAHSGDLLNNKTDFLSIIVPCFNESDCVAALLAEIESALAKIERLDYEIIFVDDGSIDGSREVLQDLQSRNRHVRTIFFVRNFGKEAALLAGLQQANGDAVLMIDADLQHPPALIPDMLAFWRQGYDVVQTVHRQQPGFRKSLSSRAFYRLLNWLSETRINPGVTDFRLMSRRVVTALLNLPEQTRFLRGLVAWLGYPSATITFVAPERHVGDSRFTLGSLTALAFDAIITLSTRPLHFALYTAFTALMVCFAYGAYVLIRFAMGLVLVKGWASTILLILFLGSVNLLCIGILGLYIQTILTEVRRRPAFVTVEPKPLESSKQAVLSSAHSERAD